MSDSVGSLDCPDCLQLLHHQQLTSQQASAISQPHPSTLIETQNPVHDTSTSRNASTDISFPLVGKTSLFSQLEASNPHNYPLSNIQNVRATPSSSALSIYCYGGGGGGDFPTSSSSTSVGLNSSSSTHQSTPLQGLSTQGLPTSSISYGCDLNYSGSVIDTCDYNGHSYCSTCAVLDLPTNDKYYRPPNPRSHVFPPIFYSQGPSSVIPCFSPIPDWTNEYNHYAYPGPFSQPTPSVPVVPPTPSDYYATSNVSQGMQNFSASLSYEACNSSVTSTISQSAYSLQHHYSNCNAVYSGGVAKNATHSTTLSVAVPFPVTSSTISPREESMAQKYREPINTSTCSAASATVTRSSGNESPLLSPSSSVEVSSNDSSGDSDSENSITSDDTDRELISVVEDDDEDGNEMSTKEQVRPGGKCLICRNLIEITDCTSPQLAKILENIEDDIGADDLDITDIEIVGMEDEVNEFTQQKKRYASSTTQGIISTARLTILLGESYLGLGTSENDSDVAILCFRCGKLASMADSLERQLSTAIQTLHHKLMSTNHPHSYSNYVVAQQMCKLRSEENGIILSPSVPPLKTIQSFDKSIQTEIEVVVHRLVQEKSVGPESKTEFLVDAITQTTNFLEQKPTDSSLCEENLSKHSSYSSLDGNASCFKNICSEMQYDTTVSEGSSSSGSSSAVNCSEDKIQDTLETVVEDINLSTFPSELQNPGDSHFTKSTTSFLTETKTSHNAIDQKIQHWCSNCKKTFSTKSNLKAHMEICSFKTSLEKGGESENMKCEKCGIGFRSVLRKQKHLEKGCKAINFDCDQCSRRFTKASELKVHLVVHSGQRNFQCGECPASFSTKGNQIAHSRLHSKDKKFQCSHCDKGFNRRFALTVHLNRHNGSKPFICSFCNQRFPDPSNLNKHRKRLHFTS